MKTNFIQLSVYPDNSLVLVNPNHIQAIVCHGVNNYTTIYLQRVDVLVKETPVQIQAKIQ